MIADAHLDLRENAGRVLQVRTAADLDAVEQDERVGLMLSLEGVEQFGYEAWPAETFWELGVRMAGLTWNRRNPYADGAAENGGLSRLGRVLVDRLVELGVKGPEDYPALLAAMSDRGWGDADIDAVCSGNLLGFLRRALPTGSA